MALEENIKCIFDLEQNLLEYSKVTDDVAMVNEYLCDDPSLAHMPADIQDTIMNKLFAIEELYKLRFERVWKNFESVAKHYHEYRREVERTQRPY